MREMKERKKAADDATSLMSQCRKHYGERKSVMSQKGTKIHTAGIAADPAFADRDLLASRACKLFGMSCPIEVAETSAHLPDNLFRRIICTGGFFRTPGLGLVVVVAPEGGTLQCQKMRDEAQKRSFMARRE